MKVIAQPNAGTAANEGKSVRLERPLDMALCTIIPKGGGVFSIQLPAVDWEDGLQAVYAFTYDGKGQGGETVLPGAMQVVPVLGNIASHCMDAADGNVTEDCLLGFEQGRTVDIQTDVQVHLTAEDMGKLNAFLSKWNS